MLFHMVKKLPRFLNLTWIPLEDTKNSTTKADENGPAVFANQFIVF